MVTLYKDDHTFFMEKAAATASSKIWKTALLGLFILMTSVATAVIVIKTDGNFFAGGAFLAALTIILVTFYRLDLGFFLFLGSVLVFDQYDIPGFNPPTLKVGYFKNLKEIPYIPYFSGGVVNPLEIQLFFLILVWVLVLAVSKKYEVRRIPIWGAAALFFLGIVGSYIHGVMTGGDPLVAMWEVRALFYLGILFVFVPQIIQTRDQIRAMLWVCITAITFKALQGMARWVALGFNSYGFETLTNHEDALFIVTLVVFLLALVLFDAKDRQRSVLIGLLLPLYLGFYAAQRRAAYAAIPFGVAIVVALLSAKQRVVLFKTVVPIVILLLIYGVVFWNSDSKIASPIRLVKSGLSNDPETSGERFYSNLYREFEKMDLAVTVRLHPAFGIGYGNKYEMPVPLARISFPLRDFIPHDQILWVIVKTGAVGFFLFCFFFDAYAFKAASLLSKLKDPYLKAVLALMIAAIGMQIVISYYDLQLTYYRNMVYLGSLMGLLPSIEAIHFKTQALASQLVKKQPQS